MPVIREAMGGSKGSDSKVAFRAHSVETLPVQSSSVWSWKGGLAGPAVLRGAVDQSWWQKPLPGRQALLETCLLLLQAESLCVHQGMLSENTVPALFPLFLVRNDPGHITAWGGSETLCS